MSIGPPISKIQYFQNLTLKIKGQGQMTMMLHNYRSRQFHRTSNGTDPSRGFRDMFLAHGQAHMGQMGKWPWQCTTTGLDNSTELRMEKIHQEVTEIWVPQVWQPPARPLDRPPTRPPGPWRQYPSSPEGWGVKKCKYIFVSLKSFVAYWRHMALEILANTCPGNGMLSDDTKPLPEPMLT